MVKIEKIEDFDFFSELKDDLWDVKYPPAPRATRLWNYLLQVINISLTSLSIFQVFKFFNESFDFEPSV